MKAADYKRLVDAHVTHKMTFEEFEAAFDAAFDDEPENMDEALFQVLDRISGAIHSYWPGLPVADETRVRIGDATFRQELEAASADLGQLQR